MNASECDEIRDDLVAFADGELAHPAAERVRRHTSRCAGCAALVDSLRRSLAVAKFIWTDAVIDMSVMTKSPWKDAGDVKFQRPDGELIPGSNCSTCNATTTGPGGSSRTLRRNWRQSGRM